MSEILKNSGTQLSPIAVWWAEFEKQPVAALDNLLTGRAYMGNLNRNETSEILFRLFHAEPAEIQNALDQAMLDWLQKYWGSPHPSLPAMRWAEVLQNAFLTVDRLRLPQAYDWLLKIHVSGRAWLRSLYLNPSRDPEAAYLRTLALRQNDQGLLPVWMRLCRLEEDRPWHHASLGILGLRKLPEKNGEPAGDLHPALFSGIVNLANALAEQAKDLAKARDFWSLECRGILALYPRSTRYWVEHFLPLIYQEPHGVAAEWLGRLVPRLKAEVEGTGTTKGIARKAVQPPSRSERETMLALLKQRPLKEIRTALTAFLAKYRLHANQTGNADFLVKTFCNVGYKILQQDPVWALRLVEEAFLWAPYNYVVWNERAIIEAHRGRYARAVALLWEAKRKFPEEPKIRTILAEILRKQGNYEIAEIIYWQSSIDFPTNAVCRNGLAEVLKQQHRFEEAEAVYRQTIKDFPDNAVCRNGLAEVLKQQHRLEEAEVVYRQAIEDFPHEVFCRTGLAEVLKQQHRLKEAETIYRQTMKDFPDNAVCRTGLAEVLKQQHRLEEAEAAYRQAIKDFPYEVFCRIRLAVLLLQQKNKRDEGMRLLDETAQQFPNNQIVKNLLEKVKGEQENLDTLEVSIEAIAETVAPPEKTDAIDSVFTESDEEAVKLTEPAIAADGTKVEASSQPAIASEPIGGKQEDAIREDQLGYSLPPAFMEDMLDNEEMQSAPEIGLADLYRMASRWAEGKAREAYLREAISAYQQALDKTPNNVWALLAKSWWLLDHEPENADNFFSENAIVQNSPHVLGFNIGRLRAKALRGEKVSSRDWHHLVQEFSNKRTIIRLENARQELFSNNGTTLPVLEELRKQFKTNIKELPLPARKNEEWVRSAIAGSLFQGIDLETPLTENALPQVLANHEKSEFLLNGLVEQCLSSN